jgi:dipeptidase E
MRIVAAGRGRTMSLPKVVDTVMSLVVSDDGDTKEQKQQPRLVYLGTATFDKEDAMEAQVNGYRGKCDVSALKVSEATEKTPTTDELRSTLESADIIMVSGGNTLYAVNRWKALGMDTMLRRAASRGAVMCGGSAGAICWFDEGHSDSLDPTTFLKVDPKLTDEQKKDWKYIRVNGLGMLSGFCVPHHDSTQSNGSPRSEDSNAMMLGKPNQAGVGIDEDAALVVEDGKVRVICANDEGDAKCCIKHCIADGSEGYKMESKDFSERNGVVSLKDFYSGMF